MTIVMKPPVVRLATLTKLLILCFFVDGSSGSICAGNEFACSVRGPCIPLAFLCDGVGNCPNGNDESLCGKRICKCILMNSSCT